MPPVSVVVPTFNRASLIGQTLDAILAQTTPPAEVIVVDDGSTDETAAALVRFDGRIRLVRIANSGDMVARNVGVRAARSALVAFCDSDDLWAPDFLAAMGAQFEAVPSLRTCYSNFRILNDHGVQPRSKLDDAPPGFLEAGREAAPGLRVFGTGLATLLLRFQPLFPSCLMVEREAFLSAGGWDEGVSRILGCDFATAIRLALQAEVGLLVQPLVCIRKHGSNISGNTEAMNLGDARVLEHVLATVPALAEAAPAFRRSIAARRLDALDSAFARRDFPRVREIGKLVPTGAMRPQQRMKRAVATLPGPLAAPVAALLSRPAKP